MSEIKPATGFVGYFDILGYTQIMLNNNIHKTAQFVSDTLMNIPRDMIASLRSPYLRSDRWKWRQSLLKEMTGARFWTR